MYIPLVDHYRLEQKMNSKQKEISEWSDIAAFSTNRKKYQFVVEQILKYT